jgi:hypothetical protein
MDQKEFEANRRKTIELLNPEVIHEMKNCAEALNMSFEEFVGILDRAAEDEEYYESMGDNQEYDSNHGTKIWAGYELLTGKKVWGHRVPFSCAC